ncbi:hypothetical protein A2Y85_01185 [candidate division WOR-3 bacterium RBG_13_43_14]|uniref:Methyltransferase type 11 domain-containing protein n=1 Tax=candidate division WOR-3 bacterium RBG_13_43_14 TaxID=1802590 RepID=A0A1F4UFV4_UNCW3|nr:MAG: hypothetical protein A2Y85_01185 [candidate division WOR-3 bacterium RBG_13_43_14]
MFFIYIGLCIAFYFWFSHYLSYNVLKKMIIRRNKWDLNICCGKTDGGGVNVDIIQHADLPNFRIVDNIYKLPFENKQFDRVLCSHTIEHVDDPQRFLNEMMRVGTDVTVILPPIWDVTAAFNIFEHRWLFLTIKKEYHNQLPKCIKLPGAEYVQRRWGQVKKA